jgi:hypothetical protein
MTLVFMVMVMMMVMMMIAVVIIIIITTNNSICRAIDLCNRKIGFMEFGRISFILHIVVKPFVCTRFLTNSGTESIMCI